MLDYVLGFLLFFVSLFLILLVLVQRGRGGGLAGALGGMGGQSAFGSKAGDIFTRITVGVAAVWILLCMITISRHAGDTGPLNPALGGGRKANPPAGAPADGQAAITPPAGTAAPANEPAATRPATEVPAPQGK